MTTILPDPGALAGEVRRTSIEAVAEAYGVTIEGAAKRLNLGGYTRNGDVKTAERGRLGPLPKRPDETWMGQRACDSYSADMFYPEGSGRAAQEAEAKAICAGCPVRARCLEWALVWDKEAGYAWGVHGGLNGDERRALRKARVGA